MNGGDDKRDPETYRIIGAAMEVHRQLGPGFLEAVYRDAMRVELSRLGIPFGAEVWLPIRYKGHLLRPRYKVDFICYSSVIAELKAQRSLTSLEEAQVLNYLKSSGLRRALLMNFGARSLDDKRFAFDRYVDGMMSAGPADPAD
jgi:GxxExxY protein